MSDTTVKPRPVFRNIHVTDIVGYRLPAAGLVSILHRISGLLLFLLLPFVIWMFDTSLSSEISFEVFATAFTAGVGVFAAWFVKLVALVLIWATLHHLFAGVRHLWMDARHTVALPQGRQSAIATLVASLLLTVVLGARLFGLF